MLYIVAVVYYLYIIFFLDKHLASLDRVNEESFRIKKELDDIMLPDSMSSSYVCNSTLEKNIQDILVTGNYLTLLLGYINGELGI